jgi:DNA repair exonuclease SbcCD ATPase subunit
MAELLSVRFSKIGYRDARLDGLSYSLTLPDGSPENALIIGSNSSGKTSQLHLLFSIFLPHHNELVSEKDSSGRHFAYYFEENEIGFVATEWTMPGSGNLPGMVAAKTRVVGRFSQFTNRERYEHTSVFFSFIADSERGIDDLPLTSSIPHRVATSPKTVHEAKKYLRELFDDKPSREFYLTEGMSDWQKHLRRIGFNIEQFKLMMQFTMSEGDSSSFLKKFRTNEMVLEFLCHDVLDKSSTERLHGMLVQHRESVQREPVTRAQIDAYSALFNHFVMMQPIAADYALALKQRLGADEALRMVVSRVAATLKVAEDYLAGLETAQSNDTRERECQSIECADFEARLRGVREQIASLSHEQAKQFHEECGLALNRAKQLYRAMQALAEKVQVESVRSQAEDLARQLDALSEPVRSLADDVAMAKALLESYLAKDLELADKALQKQRKVVAAANEEKKGLEELLREYSGSQGRRIQEKADLEKREVDRIASINQLVAEQLLSEVSSSPHAALSTLSKSLADAEIRRSTLEKDTSDQKAELAGIKKQLESNSTDHDRLLLAVQNADKAITTYAEAYSAVSWLPGIRMMFEQIEPDLFLPSLVSRLQDRYEKETTEITRLELEIAKLEEQIAAIEGHGGLQPPAHDVKRVIETLQHAGLNAFSWWQVFEERNMPVAEARQLVEAYPSRYGGAAVTSKRDLDKARELLSGGCGVLAPVVVSNCNDSDNGTSFEGLAVFPDVALAIDRKRSADFCEKTQAQIETYKAALPLVRQSRDDLLDAKEKLVGFLAKYAESSRLALENTAALRKNELETCQQEQLRLDEQCMQIQSKLTELETYTIQASEELQQIRASREKINIHIIAHEAGSDERVTRISKLVEELSALEGRIADYLSEISIAGERELAAQELAATMEADCSRLREDIDKLVGEKKTLAAEFRSLATSTDSARALLATKESSLNAASVDAEYIRIQTLTESKQSELSKAVSQWREKFGKLSAEELQDASDHIAGRIAAEKDVEELLLSKDAEQLKVSHAKRSLEEAENKLNDVKKVNASQKMVSFDGDLVTSQAQEAFLADTIQHTLEFIGRLNEAIIVRTAEIESCKGRVNLLRNLAGQVDIEYEPGAEPFATNSEAESELKGTLRAKAEAEATVQQVYDRLKHFSNELTRLLDSQLCAPIPQVVMNIKQELHRCEGVLTAGIDTLAEHVQLALAPLSHDLETLEQKKNIVVTEVMHDVKKAFILLTNLEKRSRIPSLGGIWQNWTNKPFVRFKTSVNPDTEQSRITVAGTVTCLAQAEGKLPSGADIVKTALNELLGNAYTIETLKPDTSPSTNYVGIGKPEGLHSWSGGQKLSGSVLFYMAMCSLLSFEGQGGGILLMDNPFGSCNHIEFVRLIVALTRQYGIQMIAYTPTEDMEIRRLYPVNVLIRKGGAAGIVKRTGHTLVQQDRTIYNGGETTTLVINPEAPYAS